MKRSRSGTDAWIRTFAVAAFALATLQLVFAGGAKAAADLLPDLVPDPPSNPQVVATNLADGQSHLLVRFDGFIHNVGAGPLEIRGSNPVNGEMTVSGQRIYRDDASFRDDNSRHPSIYFETSDGHDHWHLRSAARFTLWTETGSAQVATGAKVGFCLQDVDRIDDFARSGATYTSNATEYCRQGQPNASQIREGISPGWRDAYAAKLPFQWVELSDVAPGRYRLGAQVDPDDFMVESNEANNGPTLGPAIVTVPGYVATAGAVTLTKPQGIALAASQFGAPGQRTFQIETPPRHGTLNVAPGVPFAGPVVVYSPKPGFTGSDSFAYSARDSSSAFPRHAPAAPVTVTVPGPKRMKLLKKLRFSRRGRLLFLRARAVRSGLLQIELRKRGRRLGSCARKARAGGRFRCKIRLRRRASPAKAKLVTKLIEDGRPSAYSISRLPRRIPRA